MKKAEFSARTIEHDDGARRLGCSDLLGDFPRIADMMQDHAEAKLLLHQAQDNVNERWKLYHHMAAMSFEK